MKIFFYLICLLIVSARGIYAEKQNLKQFQEHFQDILLVIHYANPYFQTIDFLKQLYSPVFKNIVFYGDRTQYADPGEYDHVYENGDHGKFRIVYTRNGYFLARWVKDVLTNYPGYKGYIFIQDDCVMQFWNYLNLDKNKIWFGSTDICGGVEPNPEKKIVSWHTTNLQDIGGPNWFNSNVGRPQLISMFSDLMRLGLEEERAMLAANFGENGVAMHFVDFFYLPGRFAERALRMCSFLDRVIAELALTTLLGAMDNLRNWERLSYWWECFDAGDLLKKNYDPRYHWMHPLKFSYETNRDFAWKVFREHFYDRLEEP